MRCLYSHINNVVHIHENKYCSVHGTLSGKQGFDPKGEQSPVEQRGNLYVRPSIRPSYNSPGLSQALENYGPGQTEGRMDGWMYGRTDSFLGPKLKKDKTHWNLHWYPSHQICLDFHARVHSRSGSHIPEFLLIRKTPHAQRHMHNT